MEGVPENMKEAMQHFARVLETNVLLGSNFDSVVTTHDTPEGGEVNQVTLVMRLEYLTADGNIENVSLSVPGTGLTRLARDIVATAMRQDIAVEEGYLDPDSENFHPHATNVAPPGGYL